MSTSMGAQARRDLARGASAPSLERFERVLPVALWLLGIGVAFHPTFTSGFAEVQGYPGNDPLLVALFLEHAYAWLGGMHGHGDLWSPPFFFPQPGVATYSEMLIGAVPFYAPWRMLGAAPLTAYQLWVLTIWTLNYAAATWMLRRSFGVGRGAAAAGAFLFAFGSARMAKMNHQQLLVSFYQVLALMALIEIFAPRAQAGAASPGSAARGRRFLAAPETWIAIFFLALVGQIYTAVYPLFFFILGLACALACALAWAPWRAQLFATLRCHMLPIALAGLVAALLAWPLAGRYLDTGAQVGWRVYDPERLPGVLSWLLMGPGDVLYGWLDHLKGVREWSRPLHHNGVGFVTLAVAAIGLARARTRTTIALLVLATAGVFLLTLHGPGGVSLWSITRLIVPGGGAIRAVARAGGVLLLPASIGLALFLQQQGRRWPAWALVLVTAACFAEQVHVSHGFDKHQFDWRIARIASQVPAGCKSFFLTTTGGAGDADVHDDAMWVAFATGIPTVNGRSGAWPPGWQLNRAHAASEADRVDVRARLNAWISTAGLTPADVCVVEIDRRSEWEVWEKRHSLRSLRRGHGDEQRKGWDRFLKHDRRPPHGFWVVADARTL